MDSSEPFIKSWQANSIRNFPKNKVFLKRLAASMPKFDQLLEAHEQVFEQMDCLACGNCCTSSSPVFNRTDISRIEGTLSLKQGTLERDILVADSDGDFLPKTKPCPFLLSDNRCQIYEVRPRSCRSYPHTDSKQGWERASLLAENTKVCPAAFQIVEKVKTALLKP